MTERVKRVIYDAMKDFTDADFLDAAFECMDQAGLSASTVDAIRHLVLMSMDGSEMLTIKIVEQIPPTE